MCRVECKYVAAHAVQAYTEGPEAELLLCLTSALEREMSVLTIKQSTTACIRYDVNVLFKSGNPTYVIRASFFFIVRGNVELSLCRM